MSESRTLARSGAVMAAGTLASRVLGLARNGLTGMVVGVTLIAADAWNAANTLPNIFHLLLAGGVLNAVIVPQITKAMRHEDGGVEYVNRLLTLAMTIMGVTTLVLTLAAPLLVDLVVASSWDAESRTLATAFAVICLPQVFFYGLYTLLGQVLTANERFAAFMWAPALANVVAIAGLGWFLVTDAPLQAGVEQWTPTMIGVLAGSATISIAVQAFALVPPLRAIGFRYRPVWGIRGSGLGAASRMASWAFSAVAISQLAYFLTTRVLTGASYEAQQAGDQAAGIFAYSNAFLLFMLPHSLITVSLVTALFTRLSNAVHDRDVPRVTADLRRGLRLPAVVLVPGTTAMIVLAPHLLQVILPGNDRSSTDAVVGVLVAMAVGLLPYSWFYLVQRAYYAHEDGRTPFYLQLVVTVIAVSFTLFAATRAPADSATWVGVGQTLSNLVAAVLGFTLLRRSLGPLGLSSVVQQYVRLGVATLIATVLAWGLVRLLDAVLPPGWWSAVVICTLGGGLLLAVTLALAARMRVSEVTELLAPVLRRLGRA